MRLAQTRKMIVMNFLDADLRKYLIALSFFQKENIEPVTVSTNHPIPASLAKSLHREKRYTPVVLFMSDFIPTVEIRIVLNSKAFVGGNDIVGFNDKKTRLNGIDGPQNPIIVAVEIKGKQIDLS